MTDPNFWNDQETAQKTISEMNGLKELVQAFDQNEENLDNAEVSYELVKEEEDEDLRAELENEVKNIEHYMHIRLCNALL